MRCQSVAWWLRANAVLGLLLCTLVSPAHAQAPTDFTLQVTTEATSGTAPPLGSVTSAPAGINCGATCAAQFPSGTPVVLTAADAAPWIFVRWGEGGACALSTSRTCVVHMDSDRTARAVFANINPTPLVLQSYGWGCFVRLDPSPQYCDHVPDPSAGFAVLHKELRATYSEPYPDGFSSIVLDGLVNAQGAAGGLSSVKAKFDAEATSQYAAWGSQSVSSHSVGNYLVASNTLPFGTPVSVRATFHVNLSYTLDVTLNEPPYVQWGVGWPMVNARVEAGSANRFLKLERPLVDYFAPFNESRGETLDLIIQSTVGQTIPFAVDLQADNTDILAARARILGEANAQVSGPYLTISPAGVVVEQFSIHSLRYPHPDVWVNNYDVFDGTPLKLEAQVRNYSSTAMTAVVDFARSDYEPITGALPSTPVSVTVPANGTAIAELRIPSDGLSRDAQGKTRLTPIEFSASITGVGKSISFPPVKPRPIFLFNGIWSGVETWNTVVADAKARADGSLLTVEPVPGLLTADLLDPTVPYQTIATNAAVAYDFIQKRRASDNFWKYYLVGHSMGGLMIRQYLHSYNYAFAPTYPPPLSGTVVERIFTIGTPYLGSRCADAFAFVGRTDVIELTTSYQARFNADLPFSNNSSSMAAVATVDPLTCLIEGEGDGVVSVASATRNGNETPARTLFTLIGINPAHEDQTGAAGLFDRAIAPNTIGPPTPSAQATALAMAQVAPTSAAISSEWNAGSGSSALPAGGGCAVSESVRVPSGNVSLSLLSNGAGTATITSPAGVASETPFAPLFSGAMFTPSQAGTWSLRLCSASGGASFADWSAMITNTAYTHEVSDVAFSGGNQLIPVRVGVAASALLPLSASYELSSFSQKQSGSLPLSELLQIGATIPIDSSLFRDEPYLQLEIALILPDGVVLRTISTVANGAIFASSFE